MQQSFSFLITSVIIILFVCPNVDGSFIVSVMSGDEQCFTVKVPGFIPAYISGDYEWLDDNLSTDPVFVVLHDAEYEALYESEEGAREGTFSYIGYGTYHLCFSNGVLAGDDMVDNSDGKTRSVGFNFRVRPQPKEMGGTDLQGADDAKTTNILKLSGQLMDSILFLEDHQANSKARELKQDKMMMKTYGRVVKWTVLEALVLIVISGSQVLYLRKFFERKRFL